MTKPSSTIRADFLAAVSSGLSPKDAARKVGLRWPSVQELLSKDDTFRDDVARAELGALTPARIEWASVAAATPPEPTPPPAREESPIDIITREASALAPLPFGYVLWVDARCVSAGFAPLSPWMRWMLQRFFASGKQWCVALVGRGGGKSSTLVRVAVAVSYLLDRFVPPGQTWVFPFMSVSTRESAQRIRDAAAILRALDVPVIGNIEGGEKVKDGAKVSFAPPPHIDMADIRGNPISIASIAGNVGNVSGFNGLGCMIDEAAKMFDKPENAHPLGELIVSVQQTLRARPNMYCICCSSAWTLDGTHYALIKAGDNAQNFVARIGAEFIDATRAGFESVAAWEQQHGNLTAAKRIREHAATVNAESAMVPTWTANPNFGALKYPGLGPALATRLEIEGLPEDMLDGLSRIDFWLRECGSVPMDRAGGVDQSRACFIAAEGNARLTRRAPSVAGGVQKVPGAPVGDPRGPEVRERQGIAAWWKKKFF